MAEVIVNKLNDNLFVTNGLKEKYGLNEIAFLQDDFMHINSLLKILENNDKLKLSKSYVYAALLGDKFCLLELKEEVGASDTLLFIKSDGKNGDFPFLAEEFDEVYVLEDDDKEYYNKISLFAKEDIYSTIYGAENILGVKFI